MVISPPNEEANWRKESGDLLRDKIWGILSKVGMGLGEGLGALG